MGHPAMPRDPHRSPVVVCDLSDAAAAACFWSGFVLGAVSGALIVLSGALFLGLFA